MGLGDHIDDLRQHRLRADPARFHDEASSFVQRTARNCIASSFLNGHRFTAQHRLVDSRTALCNLTVNRYGIARSYAQPVAHLHQIESDFLVVSLFIDSQGGFWRQIEQRANGTARSLARFQFQDLSQ